MKFKRSYRYIVAMLSLCAVVSCDDDFNAVGSEVLGDVNFDDQEYTSLPISYTTKLDRVQTSGIPSSNSATSHSIGVYNDPVYGQSVYNVLSQMQFNTDGTPDFGDNAVLDSVVLSIPYFSTELTSTVDSDDILRTTYELDSVYGSDPMNISVFRSNYFLNDVDPNDLEERQLYYSNDIQDTFGSAVEGTLLTQITNFVPSEEEITLITPDGVDADTDLDVVNVVPQLRVKLPTDHFTTTILDMAESTELSNANNFRNYYRGIYFKTEAINSSGNLFRFNISEANITLYYTYDKVDESDEDSDGDTTDIISDTNDIELVFANNIVNGIETSLDPTIATELLPENQDTVVGEENLYLKGGDGSYAVIELFTGNVTNEDGELETELDFLRRQEWLINEANLTFYIDQNKVTSGEAEPERIYIFNQETGAILVDYISDIQDDTAPLVSLTNHLGRITRGTDDKGEFYKIKITRHLINILNGDTDNVKLGVAVSQNVNIIATANAFVENDDEDLSIPFSSVLSHEGTILYGNHSSVPDEKRLKLEIFYSEAKNN